MPEARTVEPEISIKLPSRAKKIVFRTYKDVWSFVTKEIETWKPLYEERTKYQLSQPIFDGLFQRLTEIQNYAKQSMDAPVESDLTANRNHIESLLNQYDSGELIHSKSPLANLAFEKLKQGDPIDACALIFADSKELIQGQGGHDIKPIINGIISLQLQKIGVKGSAEEQLKSLHGLKTDWNKEYENYERRFNQFADLVAKRTRHFRNQYFKNVDELKDLKTDREKEFQNLRELYAQHIKLRAPAKYWSRKAFIHAISDFLAIISFIAVITVCSIAIFNYWDQIIIAIHDLRGEFITL